MPESGLLKKQGMVVHSDYVKQSPFLAPFEIKI